MDSLTQIVLGAAVAEAAAGKKMGNKAAFWGAIAGTIPDLDVFVRAWSHPIDGSLIHRGFSHSIVFAVLFSPMIAWVCYRLYKRRFEFNTWLWLFFLSIITHPMLDLFTNYGTEFLWPFPNRISFNSVFVVDPLYTVPFGILLLIALFKRRESVWRRRLNWIGIVYSSLYLVWCTTVKIAVLDKSDEYFEYAGIKGKNTLVTPMPFTSFYWMMITEDNDSFYVGYKSLFYEFQPNDINIIEKNHKLFESLKWENKDYKEKLKFISQGYYACEQSCDTINVYDLRFGVAAKFTEDIITKPIMGYGMVIDNGFVNKTVQSGRTDMWRHVNFNAYLNKVFTK
jgi:inner membrane protein